jgi:aminoglycoside 6'-N-acetyltransferase
VLGVSAVRELVVGGMPAAARAASDVGHNALMSIDRHQRRTVPTLRGPRLALRSGRHGDEDRLRDVFAAPDVARWWPQPEPGEIASLVDNLDPDVDVWMVEEDGRVVGLIQGYEEADPMYRHAGIDIVLHPEVHGRGLGPEAIRVLARHLFDDRGHHRIVIDPNAANARAIHVYEKVGFRRVGVMRRYERDVRDGRWTDGVLMDMLREELAPEPAETGGGSPP